MSVRETVCKITSKPYYKLYLLKNGEIVKELIEKVSEKSFIYDKDTKTAYIIPENVIKYKLSKIFYADIDNAIPYTYGNKKPKNKYATNEEKEIPKELITFAEYEKNKKEDKSRFRKYIVNPLSSPSVVEFIGSNKYFWIAYIPSVLIGKWMSGESISMLMESPKKENKFGDIGMILIIIGIIAVVWYLFLGGNQ